MNEFSNIANTQLLQKIDLACSSQALQQPTGCDSCRATIMPAVLDVPGIQVWSGQMLSNCAQVERSQQKPPALK